MIYIFEGVDCTGKTSLVEEVVKHLPKNNTVVKHFMAPPKGLNSQEQHDYCMTEYYMQVGMMKMFPKVNYVFDRFYFGEQIYAPKYRSYHPVYISAIEKQLNSLDAKLILVEANSDVVKSRFDGKFIKLEDIEGLLNTYKETFLKSSIRDKIILDSTNTSSNDLARQLMRGK